MSAACNEWRNSSSTAGNFVLGYYDFTFCISLPISKSYDSTADVPFFLVSIASNSRATSRHLKDWEACQEDGHKVFLHDLYHSLECLCLLFQFDKAILVDC